jgi:hypothetical protein
LEDHRRLFNCRCEFQIGSGRHGKFVGRLKSKWGVRISSLELALPLDEDARANAGRGLPLIIRYLGG